MSDNKNLDQHTQVEHKIINLMLKYTSAIDEMLESSLGENLFDPAYQKIVQAIYQEYLNSDRKRKLTRETYKQILLDMGMKGDLLLNLEVWDKCYLGYNPKLDDLGNLKRQIVESYVARQTHFCLDEFRDGVKKKGYFESTIELVNKLQSAVNITKISKTSFSPIDEMKSDYISNLEHIRSNPETVIRCGIPEIDDPMNVGFKEQHLTLVVADVGNHKSNLMLNIGLNIYDRGHSVLFIPLEMPAFDLINRIMANRSMVSFNKLARPELLTDEDLDRIRSSQMWSSHAHKFCILDGSERTSVSVLRSEIEKRAFIFRPKVVIIDYIANLEPDLRFGSRNDLEIGEILKSLRFLGKKHGFHTISAAQMGRAAIKSLREGREESIDSTSIRGSHEYAADSDTIFALMKVPNEIDKIKILTIKARHGRAGTTEELRVDPEHCLISSTNGTLRLTSDAGLEEELNIPSEVIVEQVNQKKAPVVEFDSGLDDL